MKGGILSELLTKRVIEELLPDLVWDLELSAGALCPCLDDEVRMEAYGVENPSELPDVIDWEKNGIIISPPGTGKGVVVFPSALDFYAYVIVVVPSVAQAHALENSLNTLYGFRIAGARTSQRSHSGLIQIVTTGVFAHMICDKSSCLWDENGYANSETVLFVDEAQRILENDPLTEFFIGYMAHQGLPTYIVSATIAPGRLPEVYGFDSDEAIVYELHKEMHEIDIHVEHGVLNNEMLRDLDCLQAGSGKTTLIFCATRANVASVTRRINEQYELCHAVPITGAHSIDEQMQQIMYLQSQSKAVAVVATPGTMDSSVTIPGLTTVIIDDERIRVDWNEHGYLQQYRERLPVNHIWQMIRRVGREKHAIQDKVIIVSKYQREDFSDGTPDFLPIEGCSPHTPIETLCLWAVALGVPFVDIQSYMVSTFSDERILTTQIRLLDHGMILNSTETSTGFRITNKGLFACALPFNYKWSRFILEAPEDLRIWLCVIASLENLHGIDMSSFFESDSEESCYYSDCPACERENTSYGFSVRCECGERYTFYVGEFSLLLHKLELMSEYYACEDYHARRQYAHEHHLSYRRLEQALTQLELALGYLGLDWDGTLPEDFESVILLELFVTHGVAIGLFEIYLLQKHRQRPSYTEVRRIGGVNRCFTFNNYDDVLAMEVGNRDGIVAVLGVPRFVMSNNGTPLAYLDDVTILPFHHADEMVAQMAEESGWLELTYRNGMGLGYTRRAFYDSGVYLTGTQVPTGVPFWSRVVDNLMGGQFEAVPMYPVYREEKDR